MEKDYIKKLLKHKIIIPPDNIPLLNLHPIVTWF